MSTGQEARSKGIAELMALKAIIDKLDDVAEGLRGEYRAGTKDEGLEGKFVLTVEAVSGYTLENVDGLKSALSKERGAKEAAERKAEAFKDMDPAKVKANLDRLAELEKLDPAKEADKLAEAKAQAKIEQMAKQHGEALTAAEAKAEKLMKGLQGRTRDAAINAALAKAEVINPEGVRLKLSQHIRLKDTGNDDSPFDVEVVGADGNPLVDSKGSSLGLDAFVDTLRADPAWAVNFKPAGKTGSGARPGEGGSKTMSRSQFEGLPPASRMEVIQAGTKITEN